MTIADRIDELLREQKISRRQLAIKAGIPPSSFQSAMQRGGTMTFEMMKKVADALGVQVKDLYSDNEADRDFVSRVVQLTEQNDNNAVDRDFVEFWNSQELEKTVNEGINQENKPNKNFIDGCKYGYMLAQGFKPKNVETLIAVGFDEVSADFFMRFAKYSLEEQIALINEMQRIHQQTLEVSGDE